MKNDLENDQSSAGREFVLENRTVVVTGKRLKIASVKDDLFADGEVIAEPEKFIRALKTGGAKADILTFPQKIDEAQPKHGYRFEWDNAAAVVTDNYNDWWEKRLPQETRKNARRAAKRGVTVQVAEFNDDLVKGIKAIYDECEFRQGRRFWHFGKDLDTVKRENSTYPDRSVFLGAYCDVELIGFMKFVYTNHTARMMQILSKNAHQDKRPMNALIAKAVELCCEKGVRYLVYGKFNYGNKTDSPLTEFKRRNGFVELRFPRYYVPLTLKGRIALKLRLHQSLVEVLPPPLIKLLWRIRAGLVGLKPKSAVSAGVPKPILPKGPPAGAESSGND